jgi:hypothetical protein
MLPKLPLLPVQPASTRLLVCGRDSLLTLMLTCLAPLCCACLPLTPPPQTFEDYKRRLKLMSRA